MPLINILPLNYLKILTNKKSRNPPGAPRLPRSSYALVETTAASDNHFTNLNCFGTFLKVRRAFASALGFDLILAARLHF
jgi:hypothetical protein